jgi:hypothetical protein
MESVTFAGSLVLDTNFVFTTFLLPVRARLRSIDIAEFHLVPQGSFGKPLEVCLSCAPCAASRLDRLNFDLLLQLAKTQP